MKSFALIGASGFVASRHMRAIYDTESELVAAYDPNDSVGIIDNFFPKADFFVEFERFDRHLDKLRREDTKVNFLSVCSPNYLHDSHIRFGLRSQADVICEKPIVLNPWNIDALLDIERESGKSIFSILQLRLHPAIISLKNKIENGPKGKVYDVDLSYLTSRGNWYYTSWKGDVNKSGGIATNIGVHFFDMLSWIFGDLKRNDVHVLAHDRAAGYLEFQQARVRWFLSVNNSAIPEEIKKTGTRTFRSITIEGEELEFSNGFTDLHTESYKKILEGNGFGIAETKQSIEIVHDIRHKSPLGLKGEYHPFAKLPLTPHPFNK